MLCAHPEGWMPGSKVYGVQKEILCFFLCVIMTSSGPDRLIKNCGHVNPDPQHRLANLKSALIRFLVRAMIILPSGCVFPGVYHMSVWSQLQASPSIALQSSSSPGSVPIRSVPAHRVTSRSQHERTTVLGKESRGLCLKAHLIIAVDAIVDNVRMILLRPYNLLSFSTVWLFATSHIAAVSGDCLLYTTLAHQEKPCYPVHTSSAETHPHPPDLCLRTLSSTEFHTDTQHPHTHFHIRLVSTFCSYSEPKMWQS